MLWNSTPMLPETALPHPVYGPDFAALRRINAAEARNDAAVAGAAPWARFYLDLQNCWYTAHN